MWTFGFPGITSNDAPCAAAGCPQGTSVPHVLLCVASYTRWSRGAWGQHLAGPTSPGVLLGLQHRQSAARGAKDMSVVPHTARPRLSGRCQTGSKKVKLLSYNLDTYPNAYFMTTGCLAIAV